MTTQKVFSSSSARLTSQICINRWSPMQQARLLANLARVSNDNKGWIFIANAPAPLSRQALINAGINPARVIDAKRASETLVAKARCSPSIAAVVCWKNSQVLSTSVALYQASVVSEQALKH